VRSKCAVLGLITLGLMVASDASADTLFLRAGKTLKIDALSCTAAACIATLPEGDIELRPFDVLRVEPDELVDAEPARAIASAIGAGADSIASRTIERMVSDSATKYGLPRSLVRAVARAESAFNPNAISPKGAQGVMQLMPGTARELGVENALDPAENIDGGAHLIRQLLEKYEGRLAEALAAYNAGAGAVAKHNGVPPYRETRNYIRKVVRDFEKNDKAGPGASSEKRK
jgi:soluble lytic murein transglycosylase-like protein